MIKNFLLLIGVLFIARLSAQPVIDSFLPRSGPSGTVVTILGKRFNPSAAANIVYFGAVRANITDATDSTLVTTVPVGATYHPLTVTSNNLTAYSTVPFSTTFPGGGALTTSSYAPRIDFVSGRYPHCVAVADFDNNGKSDILVSRGSSSSVSVFPNVSTQTNISLSTPKDFPATGNNHEGAAVADIDGDGKLDFLITNSIGSNSVSVYRNTSNSGNISFASRNDYPADNAPYSVAVADLDADGKPDIIIANNGSNKINVYRNTSSPGNISFATKIDFSVGTSPFSVTAADLNSDGKAELIFTTQGSTSALSFMKNTSTSGSISFDAVTNLTGIAAAFIVAAGDLDGDNKPDLAASSAAGTIIVLKNISTTTDINFAAPLNFLTGGYTECVSIADINGDGKPDLVATNNDKNNIALFRNSSVSGNLNFDAPVNFSVGDGPLYTAIGDIDGDGRPDISVANSSTDFISVFRNIVGANIVPVVNSFTPTVGIKGTVVKISGANFLGATAVKFGDVNASSFIIDSATGITATVDGGASGDVSVSNNFGTGSRPGFVFNGPIINSFTPNIAENGTSVLITGLNFTGATEVKFGGTAAASFVVNSNFSITAIVGTGSSGSVSVTTPNGVATKAGFSFAPPRIISFTPTSGFAGSTVTITGANFDPNPSGNIVFFGAVKATVTAATATQLIVIVPPGATYEPIRVTVNRLTGVSGYPFMISFPGNGSHITTSSFSQVANYGVGLYPTSIVISDLNDDGKPDLITSNGLGNNISILKNSSSPGSVFMSTKIDINTDTDPKRVTTGDLDGDGKPDIVVTNMNTGLSSTMTVLRNNSSNGNISFATKNNYNTGNGTIGVAVADMDRDGKPDIIVSSSNSGFYSFFKNITTDTGNILLAPKQDYTWYGRADEITVADIDMDGRADLVTSNFADATISIFRNISNAGVFSLASPINYATGNYASRITTGDFDSDGKVDIVVTNYNGGTISFYKNNSNPGSVSLLHMGTVSVAATNVSLGDLNGDGKVDLNSGTWGTGVLSVFENTFPGSGNFSFSPKINFTIGNFDLSTATGDLDADGKPELIGINTTLSSATILKNKINDPTISVVAPANAVLGQVVTITGTGLSGATNVAFGGTAADSFKVISSTEISAVVGAGASGDITVTTPQGIGRITDFNFIPEISVKGVTSFCKDSSAELTSTAASNNQWYRNGAFISGASSKIFKASTSGLYTVKTSNNGITTTSATGVDITVISVPAPTISRKVNALESSVATGNQWYLNNVAIAGANGQTYQPTQNGLYSIKNTQNGCVSDFSATYLYYLTAVIDIGNNQYIKLYPNPVKDKLNLIWNINGIASLDVSITDTHGRQMLNRKVSNAVSLNISKLPAGIYFMKIVSTGSIKINKTLKIVKEN